MKKPALSPAVRNAPMLLLLAISHKRGWLLLGILFLAGLSVLVYATIWRPLHSDVVLPVGVAAENPQFDIKNFQALTKQRAERVQRSTTSWQAHGRLFRAVPNPSSTLVPATPTVSPSL